MAERGPRGPGPGVGLPRPRDPGGRGGGGGTAVPELGLPLGEGSSAPSARGQTTLTAGGWGAAEGRGSRVMDPCFPLRSRSDGSSRAVTRATARGAGPRAASAWTCGRGLGRLPLVDEGSPGASRQGPEDAGSPAPTEPSARQPLRPGSPAASVTCLRDLSCRRRPPSDSTAPAPTTPGAGPTPSGPQTGLQTSRTYVPACPTRLWPGGTPREPSRCRSRPPHHPRGGRLPGCLARPPPPSPGGGWPAPSRQPQWHRPE